MKMNWCTEEKPKFFEKGKFKGKMSTKCEKEEELQKKQ